MHGAVATWKIYSHDPHTSPIYPESYISIAGTVYPHCCNDNKHQNTKWNKHKHLAAKKQTTLMYNRDVRKTESRFGFGF